MKKIQYRSAALQIGALNQLETCHIHIDGARNQEVILGLVKSLEAKENLGKLNHVYDFVAGQQREILPETYEAHTPALDGEEAFDFFSSSLVRDREDAIRVINFISGMLAGIRGAIVELEQVVGWFEKGEWSWVNEANHIRPIEADEVKCAPQLTWPLEIHHGFNLPHGDAPPLSLNRLLRFCRKNNIIVGGWFVFDKGDAWAFRSNAFTKAEGVREIVEREQAAITGFLLYEGFEVTPRTLVEKVVGIWHSQGR